METVWTAILAVGTWALAAATTWLVLVARSQLKSIRDEARKERTLNACNRYDNCPVLSSITRRLREAQSSKSFDENPQSYRYEAVSLLNYFDSIAIGIAQKLYIDELARDHLANILNHHMEEYFTEARAATLGIPKKDFPHLVEMHRRWSVNRPGYRDQ